VKDFSPEDYELIESYLKNELSEEGKQAMELRIANDPDWKNEIDWYRKFELGSRYLVSKKMFADMHQRLEEEGRLEDEEKPIVPLVFGYSWSKIAIAATVVLGLFTGLFWFLNKPKISEIGFITNPPINITVKEKSNVLINESPRNIEKIATELQASIDKMEDRPDEAIKQLQVLGKPKKISKGDDSLTYGSTKNGQQTQVVLNSVAENQRKFYLGLIYLRKQAPKEALKYFEQVKAPLKKDANWYMVLAYIQNAESLKAKIMLQIIVNDSTNPYQSDAIEILNELEKKP
jgi:hypothetical protein